jgi:hypothetical protein
MGPTIDLDQADPRLKTALADGLGNQFEQARQEAIDKLERLDEKNGLAFWLQVVGDGSPMMSDQESQIERSTLHQVAHVAGYHDELIYPDVAQIAIRLFAHHNGFFSDLRDVREPMQIARKDVQELISIANQLYPDGAVQYPEPVSIEERCDQAIALLNESDLTTFWFQLLTYEGDITTFSVSSEGETSVETWPKHPIEYVHSGPEGLADLELYQQLTVEPLIQHLFIAARTADKPLDTFGEESVKLAQEHNYFAEEPSDL